MAREQLVMTYRPASAVKEASPHTRISRARCMKPQRHTYQATRTDKGDNGRGRRKQGTGSVAEINRLVMNDLSPFTGQSESGSFDATMRKSTSVTPKTDTCIGEIGHGTL